MLRMIDKRTHGMRLFLYFLPLFLIGVLLGTPFLILFLGAMVLLFKQYKQFYRLSDWLHKQNTFSPPEGEGHWEQIFDGIYDLQYRNRQKRTELAGLIRRFRDGAEAVPDAVLVLQQDLNILWCNKLAVTVLGLKWPMDQGQRLDNLIRQPKFSQYMKLGDYQEPLELDSPLGIEQILEFRIMPYADNQLMMVVRDVTEIKHLEQMRKDFVANVSHELRTPLTVMRGYLEMMDIDTVPALPVWGRAHGTMTEQCKRMDSLVNQLLVLSKIESTSRIEVEQQVNVPAMLQLIAREAGSLNSEKQHKIELDIAPDLMVLGSESELRSAFSNLVFNAVYYTQDQGHIRIVWQLKHGKAEFAVYDNGSGIAAEHISRLTERFYRVDEARSRRTGGSGLGLSITKHVLTHHDSELKITSELGEGSCFSFSFDDSRIVKVAAIPIVLN